MGQNLARNIASHGFSVALYNRTAARTDRLMEEHGRDGDFSPAHDVREFVAALERPRSILLMVKAGEAVDHAMAELRPFLEEGDILIDGGNSFFRDTRRRAAEMEAAAAMLTELGVPPLMADASRASHERLARNALDGRLAAECVTPAA